MEEEKKEDIRQISVKEMLIMNYNSHIKSYVGNLIEATWTGGRDPKETVITLYQQSQPGLPPIERHVKAKEAQLKARQFLEKEESILKVIEDLIKKEGKKETKFI